MEDSNENIIQAIDRREHQMIHSEAILCIAHYEFDPNFSPAPKIAALCADMADNLIMKTILDAANKAGITDLYVIDKQWIVDAIQEKQMREKNGGCWACLLPTARSRLFRDLRAVLGVNPMCCPVCGRRFGDPE